MLITPVFIIYVFACILVFSLLVYNLIQLSRAFFDKEKYPSEKNIWVIPATINFLAFLAMIALYYYK